MNSQYWGVHPSLFIFSGRAKSRLPDSLSTVRSHVRGPRGRSSVASAGTQLLLAGVRLGYCAVTSAEHMPGDSVYA